MKLIKQMAKTKSCSYHLVYNDPILGKNLEFKCKESPLDSGKCKFHDKDYLYGKTGKKEKDIADEIIKKLNTAAKNGKPLKFIGYYLPAIELKNHKITCDILFQDTFFKGKVNFSKTDYSKKTYFLNCKFIYETNFSDCTFQEISFKESKFYNKVSFTGSNFVSKSNFQNVEFKKDVVFQTTVFTGESTFQKTLFTNAKFDLTFFEDNISFYDSYFKGETSFWKTYFNKTSNFSIAEFEENVDFKETEFRNTIFLGTKFRNEADFEKSKLYEGRFEDIESSQLVNFKKVQFKKPDTIYFNGDLSEISFLDTDVTRIHFGDHTFWNKLTRIDETNSCQVMRWFRRRRENNNKFKIKDERILENTGEIRLEGVLNIYRNLRENFDLNMRYEDAGQFFIRERELKRKFKDNELDSEPKTVPNDLHLQFFSLSSLYYGLAKYGESLKRPTLVAISILILGTCFFLYEETNLAQQATEPPYTGNPFENAVIRSLTSFFPFYGFDNQAGLVDLLFKMALLPVSGSMFIGLRRKLERRFRH